MHTPARAVGMRGIAKLGLIVSSCHTGFLRTVNQGLRRRCCPSRGTMLVAMTDEFRSGDALFSFDDDLRVVSWNDAARELTGLSAEEAVGRPCWEVLCGVDDRGAVVCHKGCSGARLAREGWPVSAQELLVKTTGGRRRVMVSTIAVRGGDSDPVFLHVLRDGLEEPDKADDKPVRHPMLTPRQLEVLRALSSGEQAKLIAQRLGIAEATARNHIRMILVELGCHSQLEAVAEARRQKLIN